METKFYKAIILGTSNSITKDGFGSILIDDPKFIRFSIGDTTSLSGIYNLLNIEDLHRYKYAILDFNVNETTFILSFNYPFKWVISTFSFIIKKLLENRVLPIVVSIYKDGYTWLKSYQQIISEYFNLPFIDIKEELKNLKYSAYLNDTVHYIKDVQFILANKIRSVISEYEKYSDYEFDLCINDRINKIPDVLKKLNFYNLKSSNVILRYSKPVSKINVHNSLVDLTVDKISLGTSLYVQGNCYLCAIVYWSDENTSYVKISSQSRSVYKNLHNKSIKPLLVVRSIGYLSQQFDCKSLLEINPTIKIDNNGNTEYTHNSVDNDIKNCHIILADLLFSNFELNSIGNKLIEIFNLSQCEYKYTVWFQLKTKDKKVDKNAILRNIKSIENFESTPEWCFYVCKYLRNNLNIVNKLKAVKTNNFYFYDLIAQFLCTKIEEKIFFFKKALSLCHNDFSTSYLIADTYFQNKEYEEALSSVEYCLLLKPQNNKALQLKELIISKIESDTCILNKIQDNNSLLTKKTYSETRKVDHELDLGSFPNIYLDVFNAQLSKKYLNYKELRDKFDKNPKRRIILNELTGNNIPFLFEVDIDNTVLNCLFQSPESKPSDKLFVSFTSGHRNDYKQERFIRCKYSRWINENFLCIDDPSIFINSKFSLSTPTWYIGDSVHDVYKSINKLVLKITDILNIKKNNVFFYGSSVGGYAAIFSSYLLDGSNAIALSPQIKPSLFESYGRFARESDVDLSNENDRRADLTPLIKSSNSNFFIIFNDINKSDVKQIEILQPLNSIPLGIFESVNISNVIFWRHSTAAINTHNANPEQFGIVIIFWLLIQKQIGNDINRFHNLSILINELFGDFKLIERECQDLKNQITK